MHTDLDYYAKNVLFWCSVGLPVNYLVYYEELKESAVATEPDEHADNSKTGNKMLRLLKVLRLLKLLRLARVKRIIARYEKEYYSLIAHLKILKVILVVGCVGHWMCCGFFAAGSYDSGYKNSAGEPLQGWVARMFGGQSDVDSMTQYSISLYWSMMTMTTVGYGDISPQTEYEYWFVTVAMLLGGFVFGMIVGFLGDISKDANPEEAMRTRSAALLNALAIRQEKHPELIHRVHHFKTYHDHVQTALDTLSMLKELPWSLASELAIAMTWIDGFHGHDHKWRPGLLHRVPFFQGLPEMSTITICSRLKHSLVIPHDSAGVRDYIFEEGHDAGHEMFIVMHGSILILCAATRAKKDQSDAMFESDDAESARSRSRGASPGKASLAKIANSHVDDEPIGALKDGDFFGELGVLLPPESKAKRQRSAYAEVETSIASLSYYDVMQLRHEDPAGLDEGVPTLSLPNLNYM